MTLHDSSRSAGTDGAAGKLAVAPSAPAPQAPAALSEGARRFYEHVERHPELLARRTFAELLARLERLVPDLNGLVDGPYGLHPWPTLMTRHKWDELAAANLSIARLVRSLPRRVFADDPRSVAEFYGLESPGMAALLLSEPNALFETLVRGDWVDTDDGIRCVEMNFGNLGSWQNASMSDLYLRSPEIEAFQRQGGVDLEWIDTVDLMLRHVVDHCRSTLGLSAGELNVAMTMAEEVASLDFTPMEELYDRQLAEILAAGGEPLEGRVLVTVPSRLEVADGVATIDGVRIHALVDQSIGILGHEILRDLFRAFKAGRIQLYSGPISMVLAHKKNLALLSRFADTPLFDDEERRLIHRYVPFTRVLAPGPIDYEGRRVLLPRLLREQRERFVLKAGLSVGGTEVFVGRSLDAATWERALKAGLADGGWVVQEFLDTATYLYQSGEQGSSPHRAVWGVFAFGDVSAGLFVRLSEVSNSPVVNISRGAEAGLAFVARERQRAAAEIAASPLPAAPSEPLSDAARRFYEHTERHPELGERRTFGPLFERAERLIPALSGKPDGQYGLQPWPTLMTAAKWDELAAANLAVARLVRSLPERVFAGDPRRVAEFYGLESPTMASLLLGEPSARLETPVRGDWVDTADGIRCLEMNFGNLGSWQNASLSDLYLGSRMMESFRRESGVELEWTHTAALLLRHMVDHCRSTLELADGEINLAVVVAEEGAELIFAHPEELYNRELEAILAAGARTGAGPLRGRVLVTVPSELEVVDGVPMARGVRIHGMVDQSDQPASRDLFRAFKAGRIQLFSGPIILVLAHKKNLALLSQHAEGELFDDRERELIHRYIPFTRVLAADPIDYRGRRVLLPDLLREEQDRFVLKGGVSVGGKEVIVGRTVDRGRWEAAIAAGSADGGWIAQEFLDTATYRYQGGERGGSPHRAVWGVFAFGDRPAGLFVRLSQASNSPVVNISQGAEVGLAFVVREGTR